MEGASGYSGGGMAKGKVIVVGQGVVEGRRLLQRGKAVCGGGVDGCDGGVWPFLVVKSKETASVCVAA